MEIKVGELFEGETNAKKKKNELALPTMAKKRMFEVLNASAMTKKIVF